MRAYDIQPGMTLKLKRERQEAYGANSPLVVVTGLRPDKTYKKMWVLSGTDCYKTSDFECRAYSPEPTPNVIPNIADEV